MSDNRLRYLLRKRYKTSEEKQELELLVKEKGYIYESDGQDDINLRGSSFFSNSEKFGAMTEVAGNGRRSNTIGDITTYCIRIVDGERTVYFSRFNDNWKKSSSNESPFFVNKTPIKTFKKADAEQIAKKIKKRVMENVMVDVFDISI